MFFAKHLTIVAIFVCLAVATPLNQSEESVQKDLKVTPANSLEIPVLKELKSVQTTKSGDTLYSYVCNVGQNLSSKLGCIGSDSYAWASPQNVDLNVWCDKSNVGARISNAEVHFVVSTQNVACVVSGGGLGSSFLEVKVSAYGTTSLQYKSYFYVY
ncbi:uncharacterized protein LOC133324785 [Musca vetustissima]|uniref:uncharacterized protein LOC133324785 n=1 Tax=Musca vetustissima TaxID=27455 RepID=UPI002AB7BAF3|nr:uncharacterized protein LOC133324785 [Musca vetustissima]